MFCEGLQQSGQHEAGSPIATVPRGANVVYESETCEPDIDANGQIAVKNGDGTISRIVPTYITRYRTTDTIVWTPAKGDWSGVPTVMTGRFLAPDAKLVQDSLGRPIVRTHTTSDGATIFSSLTRRIGSPNMGMPITVFIDGEPLRGADGDVIAPIVQSEITDYIDLTGLSQDTAQRVVDLVSSGAAR